MYFTHISSRSSTVSKSKSVKSIENVTRDALIFLLYILYIVCIARSENIHIEYQKKYNKESRGISFIFKFIIFVFRFRVNSIVSSKNNWISLYLGTSLVLSVDDDDVFA